MKKLTLLMAILFAGAMVFAQNPYGNEDGNNAFIDQISGVYSSIEINQIGDQNTIEGPGTVLDYFWNAKSAVYQYSGGSSGFYFSQEDFGNYAWINQEANFGSYLYWRQDGLANYMKLNQLGDSYALSYGTYMSGGQEGDNNVFGGLDNADETSTWTSLWYITSPVGLETAAYQESTDGAAWIVFNQYGNSNMVGLWQKNTEGDAIFDLNQTGNYNRFAGYQYNDGAGTADCQMVVDQYGDYKYATNFQKNTWGGGNSYVSVQH